jgi:hypothetical protein
MGLQHNGIVTESPEPQGGVLYLVGHPHRPPRRPIAKGPNGAGGGRSDRL